MKSKEEHILNGTYRNDRHAGKVDVKAIDDIPEAPKHLNSEEAEIFTEIAVKMIGNESLSTLDVYALESFAVQLTLSRKAKKELEKTGEYITPHTNKNGSTNLVPSPWLIVLKNSSDILLKLSAKLGLTPVDRAKASKVERAVKTESLLR